VELPLWSYPIVSLPFWRIRPVTRVRPTLVEPALPGKLARVVVRAEEHVEHRQLGIVPALLSARVMTNLRFLLGLLGFEPRTKGL
jgi:hypothetical protein